MSDQHNGAFRVTHPVDAFRHQFERINVQPRISLVEYCQIRLQHGHLQNLIALLFAAGKPFVDGTRQQFIVHAQQLHLVAHQVQEFHCIELL